jgi:hypothetical protein
MISFTKSSFTLCFFYLLVIYIITFQGSRVGFIAFSFPFYVGYAYDGFSYLIAIMYDLISASYVNNNANVYMLSWARAFSILSSYIARISDLTIAVSALSSF